MRSGQPDPLGANIVHVRENRRNGPDAAGRLRSPGGRIKMLDKELIQALVRGKDPGCAPAKFNVNLLLANSAFTGGHKLPAFKNLCYSRCTLELSRRLLL